MHQKDTEVLQKIARYQISCRDMSEAEIALDELERGWTLSPVDRKGPEAIYRRFLADALVEIATVRYARPFNTNYGTGEHKKIPTDKFVPKHLTDLHSMLLNLRNRVVAHSDGAHQKIFRVEQLNQNFIGREMEALPLLHEKLDQFRELIKHVRASLISEIDSLESQAK